MRNGDVAQIFQAMADSLAILGANYHRIMAYQRAAENILLLGQPIEEVWRAQELSSIPGIGSTLAAKIDELMCTGCLAAYERLKAQVPPSVVAMLGVPGVGPKRAATFWRELGITSIADLEGAARDGRLRELPGVGARFEERVLAGIDSLNQDAVQLRDGPTAGGVASST